MQTITTTPHYKTGPIRWSKLPSPQRRGGDLSVIRTNGACDMSTYLPEEGQPAYGQGPHNSACDFQKYNVFAGTWRTRAQGRKTPVSPTICARWEKGNDQKWKISDWARNRARHTFGRWPGMYSWLLCTRAWIATVTSTTRSLASGSGSVGPYDASRITRPSHNGSFNSAKRTVNRVDVPPLLFSA
jgi:hypothetical protein